MESSNFLIIGSKGQLGTELREKYPRAKAVDSDELDITDPEAVKAFDWSGIDTILNVAAYTNVDGAESAEGRKLAWAVNASAVANLARIAREKDMTLIHISTDYVFDGSNDNYKEADGFAPLSVYGASKAAGDIAASSVEKHYILRTSWVIGQGKNFVRTMMALAEKGVSPTVVNDQIGRLTFTSELARAIDHLLKSNGKRKKENGNFVTSYGTYNVTNDGTPVSWADITTEIFRLMGKNDLKVTPTTTQEYFVSKEGIAPRPLNSILDLSKLKSTGFKSRVWQDDLEHYVMRELKRRTGSR